MICVREVLVALKSPIHIYVDTLPRLLLLLPHLSGSSIHVCIDTLPRLFLCFILFLLLTPRHSGGGGDSAHALRS